MAPLLKKELEQLGYPINRELPHGIETEGTMHDAMRLNQSLFTAHRIMYRLSSFTARNPDELYDEVIKIPWYDWIDIDGYFRVDSAVRHPSIKDSRFANLKVKDAIVDRMKEQHGRRPDSGNEHKGVSVFLFWNEREAGMFIDTTGEPLSKRGYRVRPHAAPMQETLAAAVILETGWEHPSPLLNPMCGGGTIAIEAALMATKRLPGLLRSSYSYQRLRGYDAEADAAIRSEIEAGIIDLEGLTIIASDNDPGAIRASILNAEKAGVADLITFVEADFRESPVAESDHEGIIIINAEYGDQLGDETSLKPVYHDIGNWFKQKCQGYTGYLFTGSPELAKSVGLKPDAKVPFLNAKIECRLLKYSIYRKNKDDQEQAN